MKLTLISILGFMLLVSYQNCADTSSVTSDNRSMDGSQIKNNPPAGDMLTCMAIATDYVEMSFDFAQSNQTGTAIPQNIELEINGETVFSSCSELPNGYVIARKEGKTLHIRQDLLEDGPYVNMEIKLSAKASCNSTSSTELLSVSETPNYESHSICNTEALHWQMTYLVN